jgi:hypothetical protein
MPVSFQVGDTADVEIDGETKFVTWIDVKTMRVGDRTMDIDQMGNGVFNNSFALVAREPEA